MNYKQYISVVPRIVDTHKSSTICISPRYSFVQFDGIYQVSVIPRYRFTASERVSSFPSFDVKAFEGKIKFDYMFTDEQEYIVSVVDIQTPTKKGLSLYTSIYALESDLIHCYAVKGDLHMHTAYSDGLESPEHRLAIARQRGMDFLAITDHNCFSGSERAIELSKRFNAPIVCIHGEEVHPPHCPVHILSIGANTSISKQIKAERTYCERMASLASQFKNKLPMNVDPFSYAVAQDTFDRINKANGISVLCHIYWDSINISEGKRMGAPEQLIEALVDNRKFDVFEVTSGAPLTDLRANNLQDVFWHDKMNDQCPIIGITDSHTSLADIGSIFGENYSIVFIKQFTEEGVIDAIRHGLSVSVDGVAGPKTCHGSLRLCKYASFLLEEYFPLHDRVVCIEGELMERATILSTDVLESFDKIYDDSYSIISKEWKTVYPRKEE